jgi:hypothetical protein
VTEHYGPMRSSDDPTSGGAKVVAKACVQTQEALDGILQISFHGQLESGWRANCLRPLAESFDEGFGIGRGAAGSFRSRLTWRKCCLMMSSHLYVRAAQIDVVISSVFVM